MKKRHTKKRARKPAPAKKHKAARPRKRSDPVLAEMAAADKRAAAEDVRAAGWKKGALTLDERMQICVPWKKIKIGKRHRKEMGNIAALARDINEHGLLHAIVVSRDNILIAGERRLKAWQLSIFRDQPIPVRVVPLEDIVAGEWAENDPALRMDFRPSEAVAIKREIEARLKPLGKARQAHGKTAPGRKGGPAATDDKINAGERAASFTGKSRRTIEKAEAIVDAAEKNPSRFGKLKSDMDKSGRVDGPFKRLQTMQAAEQIRKEPPPLPGNGPYRGIVVDPPWAAEPDDEDPARLERGYYPYPTMTPAQIAAVPVASIAHDDCVLGLWITNYHLARGDHVEIFKAWGFDPVTIKTWVKDRMGRGQVLRGQTEHCIIATRGKPVIQVDNITTFFHGAIDKKRHSLKPKKFFDDFERLVAAPRYATLFETVDRGEKWDGHGDMIPAVTIAELKEAAE